MKKVLEMREKRAKAWDAAKAFLDTRAKDGVLSVEDNAIYEKMQCHRENRRAGGERRFGHRYGGNRGAHGANGVADDS